MTCFVWRKRNKCNSRFYEGAEQPVVEATDVLPEIRNNYGLTRGNLTNPGRVFSHLDSGGTLQHGQDRFLDYRSTVLCKFIFRSCAKAH